MTSILDVRDLTVEIPTEDGIVHAANKVSFSVEKGSLFGIAGESGSGKSVLTQAIMGFLPNAEITGTVTFEDEDLLKLDRRRLRALRGARIGMIFQDPLSSLHPYYTIGTQIAEMIHTHEKVSDKQARARVVEMLERVGIRDAEHRFDDYPHQFSGGMRQRVMIAMALILNPPLIIADEPTTALDVTVQAQIIELLDEMRRERGTTVIMITHDLSLLSSIAEKVMVMYAGNRMELGPAKTLFSAPVHPYTTGLLNSSPAKYTPGTMIEPISGRPPSLLAPPKGCVFRPRCTKAMDVCAKTPPLRVFDDGTAALCWQETEDLAPEGAAPAEYSSTGASEGQTHRQRMIEAVNVHLSYETGGGMKGAPKALHVLKGIDLTLYKGETLGLVGESGCGKSTLARVLAGLVPASSGDVVVEGQMLDTLTHSDWRAMRKRIQLVFQDPFGSLNPRRRVSSIIGDPFRIHKICAGAERKRKVQELMERVGLNPEHYNRYPSEFSGGQRQRIGIARALALHPDIIIFDEPVSALDVSIQAQILNLMRHLQEDMGLTYLFISHDLSVVRHVCDRIAVMNKGQIVELDTAENIYARPRDPYTRELMAASMHDITTDAPPKRRLIESIGGEAA
ncbi:dipeptide ABC transporter ATP-binding protein [Martelella mediterranea]|uniref:Peptide/nickel transport system ATP-binding protein n=1 Tax=Martelella mediterranea TaxID=293089 RepID=A0A4R3NIU3_9HYPH|nr:ABC transporter ATP-binding protein [Martelella mediterranea]TCT31764.1 peptide/nickel transport system ATP-binding protein [Martelella mediterranea]